MYLFWNIYTKPCFCPDILIILAGMLENSWRHILAKPCWTFHLSLSLSHTHTLLPSLYSRVYYLIKGKTLIFIIVSTDRESLMPKKLRELKSPSPTFRFQLKLNTTDNLILKARNKKKLALVVLYTWSNETPENRAQILSRL